MFLNMNLSDLHTKPRSISTLFPGFSPTHRETWERGWIHLFNALDFKKRPSLKYYYRCLNCKENSSFLDNNL